MITAETIREAIEHYRLEAGGSEDWWRTVAAPGYVFGVDVNIHFDPEEGEATRRALVYPNITDKKGLLTTDTSRVLAVFPEAEWPA